MSENIDSFLQFIEEIYKNIGKDVSIRGINQKSCENAERKTNNQHNLQEKCSFCQNQYTKENIYYCINIHYDYSGQIEIVPFSDNLVRYSEVNGLKYLVCRKCCEIIKIKIGKIYRKYILKIVDENELSSDLENVNLTN